MRFIIILFVVFIISSCSSKKDIIYFQDFDQIEKVDTKYSTYKLKTDDVLKIDISAENFAAVQIFDKLGPSNNNNNTDSYLYNGYQIDSNGFIDFPTLGKIKAEGLTTTEIKDLIFKMLVDDDFLVNPFVDVKLINAYFTIIGEVNSPGRYTFLENNLNIIEAIGLAGDLNITGSRDNIKIFRKVNNKNKVILVDLTSSLTFKNENFQIFSGDIIVVNPNAAKVKNAGIIGNSGNLISVLSFLISTIVLVTRR